MRGQGLPHNDGHSPSPQQTTSPLAMPHGDGRFSLQSRGDKATQTRQTLGGQRDRLAWPSLPPSCNGEFKISTLTKGTVTCREPAHSPASGTTLLELGKGNCQPRGIGERSRKGNLRDVTAAGSLFSLCAKTRGSPCYAQHSLILLQDFWRNMVHILGKFFWCWFVGFVLFFYWGEHPNIHLFLHFVIPVKSLGGTED